MCNDQLTVFTAITDSYQYSSELGLSFEMVRRALPTDAAWVVHTPDMSVSPRELIVHNLPESGNVLFIREPALLVGKGLYQVLKEILRGVGNPLAVLPSDVRGYSPGHCANYYTLRSFERFVAGLSVLGSATVPYDGRQPWMFLARAETLAVFGLAEDPFELPPGLPPEQAVIASSAYMHPFLNYYKESRAELIPHVPEEVHSLLDIGCSRGGFGAAVKEARGCRVTGVEMNRHEAAAAAKILDQVWIGDLFAIDIQEKFDCITCLDVLEHFSEPPRLLEKIKNMLNSGGKIVISVPNVGHWSVVEDLIAGRWDYIPAGILCATHLRFYTRSSLLQLLESNGLRPVYVDTICTPIPEPLKQSFAAYCSVGSETDEESLSILQYVVVAEAI